MVYVDIAQHGARNLIRVGRETDRLGRVGVNRDDLTHSASLR